MPEEKIDEEQEQGTVYEFSAVLIVTVSDNNNHWRLVSHNCCAGLEIISGESLDMMTHQIHFSLVTYRFWPVKFIR